MQKYRAFNSSEKSVPYVINLRRNISLGASSTTTDLHTTAGKDAIKGPPCLMLLTLTFNLWIVWLFSSYISSPTIMTVKVISDENMMKQQFIFPPFPLSPPPFISVFLSSSLSVCLATFMSLSLPLPLSWHGVIEQWGTAEF